MLCAQVLSRAVTECLSGSCSSLEGMNRCTDCRKGLASATEQRALSTRPNPWPTRVAPVGCWGEPALADTGLASGARHTATATVPYVPGLSLRGLSLSLKLSGSLP